MSIGFLLYQNNQFAKRGANYYNIIKDIVEAKTSHCLLKNLSESLRWKVFFCVEIDASKKRV